MSRRDDDLAYGEYHGQDGGESDRGMIGDMGRRFFGGKKEVSTTTWFHCIPCFITHLEA